MGHQILLRDQWVRLRQRDFDAEVGYACVTENCEIPPGSQVEVPVEISRPFKRYDSDCWATEPVQIPEGILIARSLFRADAQKTLVRIVNLSSESYELHKDQLLSEVTRVEIDDGDGSQTEIGEGPPPKSAQKIAERPLVRKLMKRRLLQKRSTQSQIQSSRKMR